MIEWVSAAFHFIILPTRPVDWVWKPAVMCMLTTAIAVIVHRIFDVPIPLSLPWFYIFVGTISLPPVLVGMRVAVQNETLNNKLARMAMTDTLTGLDNRRSFFRQAEGKEGVILMMDVDHFKRVNDAYGHDVGDIVLQHIARHLEACIRTEDQVARFGGEEFAVLLSNATDEQGLEVANRITRGVDVAPAGRITLSVGAVAPADWQGDVMQGFKRADKALYAAKNSGRSCVAFWPIEALAS